MKVLITREKEESISFAKKLNDLGIEAVIFPTIKTIPIDFPLETVSKYDIFIFPSKKAVKYFFSKVEPIFLKDKEIIAVGEKTKKALEEYSIKNIILPETYSSEGVLKLILENLEEYKDKKILIPRVKKGIDLLPKELKGKVREISVLPVYETVLNIPDNLEEVKELFEKKEIDISVFTSPSTFKNFLKIFSEKGKEYLKDTCIAVIGTTTAKAVKEEGLDICLIPEKFTVDKIINKIKEQLS